jgi:4'-phosphopantetheinyl transferase
MPVASLRLDSHRVEAWFASVAVFEDPARLAAALAWLVGDEHARYQRFARDEDRRMFLLGRVMARSLVGRALGVAPLEWAWRNGRHGRPEIDAPNAPVRFNLAHSAGLVVCAVGVDREVGADVEHLRRRPVEQAVVRRYCAPAEAADIFSHGDRWHDRFLRYWTLKEAYLKGRGVGISLPLDEISFTLEDTRGRRPTIEFLGSLAGSSREWTFHLEQPTEEHVVALATEASAGPTAEFVLSPFDVGSTLEASGGR